MTRLARGLAVGFIMAAVLWAVLLCAGRVICGLIFGE